MYSELKQLLSFLGFGEFKLLFFWIGVALVATLVIRVIAMALRKLPRVYSVIWCLAVLWYGAHGIWCVDYYLSRPPYRHGSSSGPHNLALPHEILLPIIMAALLQRTFPILFALGMSPPYYNRTRYSWIAGAIPAVAALGMAATVFALMHRDESERRQYAVPKRKPTVQATSQTPYIHAPDPQTGPTTEGEWLYLGGHAEYSRDIHEELIALSFSAPGVGASKKFRPEAFPWIAKQGGLEHLTFEGWITDQEIVYVTPLQNLKRLWLHDTDITDRGIEQLKSLRSLEDLSLRGTKVTVASLPVLAEFNLLRRVDLDGTSVAEDEIREFCHNNPEWRVDFRKTVILRREPPHGH